MPFSTRAAIAIASYALASTGALMFLRRAGPPLAARAGDGIGTAGRIVVTVAWLALAGRLGAALELLAVAGLSLGLVAGQGQWSALPAEALVDGAVWLGAGYLLLYIAWRHVDWPAVDNALGWSVDRGSRGLLFLAAGLYFSWPLRLPVDLAAAWVQLPTTKAFEAGWGPLGAALVITAAGLGAAYVLAAYAVARRRPGPGSGVLSGSAGRGAHLALAAGTVGLLGDGIASLAGLVGTMMGNVSVGSSPQIAFGIAILVVTYPLALAAAAGVLGTSGRRWGRLVTALLVLTLASHLAWPLDLAGRLYNMSRGLSSGPAWGLVVLAAVAAVAAALAAADFGPGRDEAPPGPPPSA